MRQREHPVAWALLLRRCDRRPPSPCGAIPYTTLPGRPHGRLHQCPLDPSGNVVALGDTAHATPALRYGYDAFGNLTDSLVGSGQTPPANVLRFKAREYDSETGLYSMRGRYYDPFLGRFLSEDPIGLGGGINPYVFANNDPVNGSDPSGLSMQCFSVQLPAAYVNGTQVLAAETRIICWDDGDEGGETGRCQCRRAHRYAR